MPEGSNMLAEFPRDQIGAAEFKFPPAATPSPTPRSPRRRCRAARVQAKFHPTNHAGHEHIGHSRQSEARRDQSR
eukprot:5296803-Pyramimonas_sp.AAC.1